MIKIFNAGIALLLMLGSGCERAPVELRETTYSQDSQLNESCRQKRTENMLDVATTAGALGYALRAPANFEPHRLHPLLVVFPAAGQTSRQSEAFAQFTPPATARGFIVLYPAHRPLSLPQVERLQNVVEQVADNWCVDPNQIYYTGHSDGGTVTHVLSQQAKSKFNPFGIAPSAAGIRASELQDLGCTRPMSILIMHNSDDALFPAYGRSARDWWLRCNVCESGDMHRDEAACEIYSRCAARKMVKYCESAGGHRVWSQQRERILDFLLGAESA